MLFALPRREDKVRYQPWGRRKRGIDSPLVLRPMWRQPDRDMSGGAHHNRAPVAGVALEHFQNQKKLLSKHGRKPRSELTTDVREAKFHRFAASVFPWPSLKSPATAIYRKPASKSCYCKPMIWVLAPRFCLWSHRPCFRSACLQDRRALPNIPRFSLSAALLGHPALRLLGELLGPPTF